jgi:hypothetical protein
MKLIRAVALASIFLLPACEYNSSDTVKQPPTDLAAHAYVSDIEIKSVPTNVSPEFKDELISALQTHLKQCAKGTQPLKLDVAIGLFSPQNAALTILVGDSNKIKGTAKLTDPANGNVVGDFDIATSRGWGGIIAAAAMAGPEGQMANAFSDEVCKRAFASTQ